MIARERLEEHLDGELDPRLREEVESHLEACPACSARARAEGRVRARLAALAGDQVTPPALRARLVARVLGPASESWASETRGRRRAWPGPVPTALTWRRVRYGLAAAATLAGLALLWTLTPRGGVETALAAGLAQDHKTHHGTTGQEYIVRESDPSALSRWFEDRLGRRTSVPPSPPGGRLIGGQICFVNGERVAHTIYDVNGATVSYYVVPQAGPQRTAEGRVQDLNYIAWNSPQGGVFVMGSTPTTLLARLAPQ